MKQLSQPFNFTGYSAEHHPSSFLPSATIISISINRIDQIGVFRAARKLSLIEIGNAFGKLQTISRESFDVVMLRFLSWCRRHFVRRSRFRKRLLFSLKTTDVQVSFCCRALCLFSVCCGGFFEKFRYLDSLVYENFLHVLWHLSNEEEENVSEENSKFYNTRTFLFFQIVFRELLYSSSWPTFSSPA